MESELNPRQIVILGGGIAGLWTLNRLCDEGYDAVLLEENTLGGGQTLASQGIIHGGLKYALNGVLSPASSVIADMPQRWRDCLQGSGEIDLSACRILSPHYYMWSDAGIRSRLKTFLGSKALQGRIDSLKPESYPGFFRDRDIRGTVYQLTDFVIDTPSLLQILAERYPERIFHSSEISLETNSQGSVTAVRALSSGDDAEPVSLRLHAQRYILCAGEGNEALLSQAGIDTAPMQRRPLHMVVMRMTLPAAAADQPFVHCVGDSFGMTPRMTITAHPRRSGDDNTCFWYLGGELAESGVNRNATVQQAVAHKELGSLFPWLDLHNVEWGSFFIDRAEPRIPSLQRPDSAWLQSVDNVLVAWPTKLTLSPSLSDEVLSSLQSGGIAPQGLHSSTDLSACFKYARLGQPRWEEMFP